MLKTIAKKLEIKVTDSYPMAAAKGAVVSYVGGIAVYGAAKMIYNAYKSVEKKS